MLNQNDGEAGDTDEFENALGTHDTLYRDSSDEEVSVCELECLFSPKSLFVSKYHH